MGVSSQKHVRSQGRVVGEVRVFGDRPIEKVKLQGVEVQALIDTGSQITMVHEAWAQKNLSLKRLEQQKCRLHVRAVNGAEIPYSGVYVMDIEVYGVYVRDVPVLVMKDSDSKEDSAKSRDAQVIIGINVLRECEHSEKVPPLLKKVLKPKKKKKYKRKKVAKVTRSTTIASMSICHVRVDGPRQEEEGLVASENANNLPAGLIVVPTVLDSRVGHRVVRVINTTSHDILLKKKHPVALLETVEEVQETQGPTIQVQANSIIVNGQTDVNEDSHEQKVKNRYALPKSNGTATQQKRMAAVIEKRAKAFMTDENDLGFTSKVQHRIRLKSDKPIAVPYRRIPPQQLEEVGKHLRDMVKRNIIVESYSPYAAPIVVVRKKDGSIRLCIDYRRLNDETISDAFPLPRIEDSFDLLSGAKYFSTLDLGSGYHQIAMAPEDQEKTAFSCAHGSWEFLRMPMGLRSAPATFQRLMQTTLDEVIFKSVLVYLDDIMIYSKTFDEHVQQVDRVLELIIEAGLKLKPDKCVFLKSEIKYLGHTISEKGIQGNDEKIKAITDWKRPETVESLRSFLGLASYFRKFVRDFSKIAGPLHDLVTKKLAQHNVRSSRKGHEIGLVSDWGEKEEKAFKTLKQKLTEAPTLAFADFDKPFILETDASFEGLGAILSQKQEDGSTKVIAYASRRLHPTERNEANYSSYKLEFLALKWAIAEKFRDYLEGSKFVVYTDNNPLTHYRSSKLKGALEQRWIAQLESFDFEVIYRPGKTNPADALSRFPVATSTKVNGSLGIAVMTQDSVEVNSVDTEVGEVFQTSGSSSTQKNYVTYSGPQIKMLQEKDPVIGPFLADFPNRPKVKGNKEGQILQRQFRRLIVKDGVLYRRVRLNPGTLVDQLVLPVEMQRQALYSAHEQMVHQGVERTATLLRNRFYWPRMYKDIEQHLKECIRCRVNSQPPSHTLQGHLVASRPLEVLAIDFLKLDVATGGIEYALVMTDVFTKFSQVVATKSREARVVAQVLIDHWFRKFGVPERIHSDQGREFESQIIEDLCKIYGIQKSRTTAYHPQGNGQCERFNQSLIRMLSMLPEVEKKRWPNHLAEVTEAYNNTPHATTGASPYFLMFGRDPITPVDNLIDSAMSKRESVPLSQYVAQHRQKLLLAHLNAYHRLREKLAKRQANAEVRKPPLCKLEIGDIVRSKIYLSGRRKLSTVWNSEKLTVTKVQGEVITVISHNTGALKNINRCNLQKVGCEMQDDLPDITNQCNGLESDED